jgi:hypothetical protein
MNEVVLIKDLNGNIQRFQIDLKNEKVIDLL